MPHGDVWRWLAIAAVSWICSSIYTGKTKASKVEVQYLKDQFETMQGRISEFKAKAERDNREIVRDLKVFVSDLKDDIYHRIESIDTNQQIMIKDLTKSIADVQGTLTKLMLSVGQLQGKVAVA